MQYSTCETFYVNQASYNETYCMTDWVKPCDKYLFLVADSYAG
jgi:hypothetical protein